MLFQERSQQASVAGGAGDGTAETTGSCEGGTVDAPSIPVRRADSDSRATSTIAVWVHPRACRGGWSASLTIIGDGPQRQLEDGRGARASA